MLWVQTYKEKQKKIELVNMNMLGDQKCFSLEVHHDNSRFDY